MVGWEVQGVTVGEEMGRRKEREGKRGVANASEGTLPEGTARISTEGRTDCGSEYLEGRGVGRRRKEEEREWSVGGPGLRKSNTMGVRDSPWGSTQWGHVIHTAEETP